MESSAALPHAARELLLKGGGSDNASRVVMLAPGAGWEGVRQVVLDCVHEKAANACPPLIVGVGVGATFDKVAGLAKHALLREVDSPAASPQAAAREAELAGQAITSGWVSTSGGKVTEFEEALAAYVGMPRAVACNAGTSALHLAAMAAGITRGDEVIVPVPSFVCYGPLVEMAGGTPVYLEMKAENEFRLTPEQLRSAITPRTKALVLPFPSNPTGGIMERADLEAIAEVLKGTNIMVLSDEIYAELTYGQKHVSIANLPEMYDRTIVVNGFSKSHAMTGWRMGYVCGPAPVIQQMLKLHQFGIMSAPTTSQYAAIEAMRNGDKDIEHMREEYDSRRRYLVENLNRIGLTCFEPKGAFYVFPCIKSSGLTSEEFCERFLMEEKVAVIPGDAFGPGGEGFVRCCYATSMKDIAEAVSRLDNFLQNLKGKEN